MGYLGKICIVFSLVCIAIFQPKERCIGQTFDKLISDIDVESISFRIAETQKSTWVLALGRAKEEGSSLLTITETVDDLEWQFVNIKNEKFIMRSAQIVSDWTNPDAVMGYGIAVNLVDSSSSFGTWIYRNDSFEIEPKVDYLDDSKYANPRRYRILNNNLIIVALAFVSDSGAISTYFCSLDKEFHLTSLDTLNSPAGIYVDALTTMHDTVLFTDLFNTVYYTNLSDVSNADTFWNEPNWTTTPDTQPNIHLSDIMKLNANVIFCGSRRINHYGSVGTHDFDSMIGVLNSEGKLINHKYFGSVDSSIVPNSYLDEISSSYSLQNSTDGAFFFSNTVNYDQSFGSTYLHEPTRITVRKLNSQLDEIWKYVYRDTINQSRVINHSLHSLADGGVLVLNYVYDYKSNPEKKFSFHILRIKADGTPYTLSSPIQTISADRISMFPNPTNNVAILRTQGMQNASIIDVLDVQGRSIPASITTVNEVSLAGLAKGLYFVKVQSQDGDISIVKLIKE